MPERTDTPPEMETAPLAKRDEETRGTDATAGGADSSPYDNEPHSAPKAPPANAKGQPNPPNP
jgi:hypothetical protein